MNHHRPVRLATTLAIAMLASLSLHSQRSAPAPASTSTYVDIPLSRLQRAIPSLAALKPDPSQDNLDYILNSVGETISGVVPQLPDLISREEVYRSQNALGPSEPRQLANLGIAGTGGVTTLTPQDAHGQEFRYLLLCRRAAGSITIEESRTDPSGHPFNALKANASPLGSGFAYQWLLFSSANQSEFRFRYLGEEQMDGRSTFVLAFSQIPDHVKVPAVFASDGRRAPYYYQGILWVDQDTFNIVTLRTDLLAPLSSLQLSGLTTELHFRDVPIHGIVDKFWLPSEVRLSIEQSKSTIEELHQYTDYRLYKSEATIILEHAPEQHP